LEEAFIAMIFSALINNITHIIALSILYSFIIRRWKYGSRTGRAISGFLFGAVAVVGMSNPLIISPGLIFDGRSIIISIAGFIGGWVTALIAALMGIIYRVWLGGPGAIMGVSVIASSAAIGIVYHYIRRRRPHVVTPLYLIGFGIIVHICMLALTMTLPSGIRFEVLSNIAIPVILIYPLGTLLVCVVLLDLESRIRAEDALRESEERYRRIVETSLEGIWILNEERRTIFVNKRIADMLGYTPEEMLGKRIDSFIFEGDLEDYALKRDARQRGVAEVFERRFRRKDKTTIWNIVSTSPLFDGQGRFTGSFAMFTDITERKLAEEALRVSEQAARRLANESELIAEIGRIISSTLNIEEVYACFAEKVREAIPFDRIAVNTVNMKNYTRTIRYVTGDMFASYGIGQVISLVGTGIEQAIQTKSSILINSKSPEDIRRKLLAAHQFGAESTMLIPLIFKDEVMGYLAVHSAQIDAYSEDDLRLAERMASQIAGAIANAQLFRERTQAEEKLQNTLDSLRKALSTTIQVMVSTVEARDPYTAGHQIRAADLARTIATEMGLSPEKIEGIRMAGSIHDIGKISIPAEILSKPTKLSEIEFSLIKEHSRKGSEMLKNVESPWPLAEIVHQHHERMDGSGYPRNLKGEEILMEARILTVADVVEAMASHRPYRPGLGIKVALDEIEKNRGIFYDTAVAGACLRLFREKGFKLEGS
jgi:PAS domain S-box-containing protein